MKTITWIGLLCCFMVQTLRGADTVRLDWEPSQSSNVLYYVVHYGQGQRSSSDPERYVYSVEVIVPTPTNFLVITNITTGVWYFSATAVLTNGFESLFSNEVTYVNRAFPPMVLRITGPTDAVAVHGSTDGGTTWRSLAILTATNTPLVMTAPTNVMLRAKPMRLAPPPPPRVVP